MTFRDTMKMRAGVRASLARRYRAMGRAAAKVAKAGGSPQPPDAEARYLDAWSEGFDAEIGQ